MAGTANSENTTLKMGGWCLLAKYMVKDNLLQGSQNGSIQFHILSGDRRVFSGDTDKARK